MLRMSMLIPVSMRDWLHQLPWPVDLSTLSWQQTLSLTASGVLGLSMVGYLWKRYQDRNLPPGPSGWPVVGCSNLMEGWTYQDDLMKLGKKYGDVFSLKKGSTLLIVLNSYSAIKEAFVDQAEVFACRPLLSNTMTAFQLQDDVFSSPYQTPGWNENRTVVISCLRAAGFGPARSVETKILDETQVLLDYLDAHSEHGKPVDIADILPKTTINVIFQVAMSLHLEYDDPELEHIILTIRNWQTAMAASYVFDALPGWMVTTVFFKWASSIFNVAEAVRDLIRPEIKQHMDTLDPDDPRDFIDEYLIKTKGKHPMGRITDNIMALFPDGIDTLAVAINWVILYVTYHQDVQDKIAAEISKLTRDPRGVTWADKVNLPYTEAVIMEVMRIEPTVTTSVAHATSKEVIFRGFRIPPSAHVYANFRAAHKDPSRFEDPDSFKPERFLNSDGQVTMPDAWMAFGSGRRRCMGDSIAKMELFIIMANMVQKYRMTFPDGPKPTLDGLRTLFSMPHPYNVILSNRE